VRNVEIVRNPPPKIKPFFFSQLHVGQTIPEAGEMLYTVLTSSCGLGWW